MKSFYKEYKSGFTLIELLVVIAIIAMLTAILMPSLTKAKEQAKKVQCGAHLKGLGLALHMYAADYNDTFPACVMPGNLYEGYGGISFWWQLGLQYAGTEKKLIQCPSLRMSRFDGANWGDDNFFTGFG